MVHLEGTEKLGEESSRSIAGIYAMAVGSRVCRSVVQSSRDEDAEHNPVPQIQTTFWALVSMPIVLLQLCAEVDEVKHGTELSCTLMASQFHLPLKRAVHEVRSG